MRFMLVVYGPMAESEDERASGMAEMAQWYQQLGAALIDPGAPFTAVKSVTGPGAVKDGPTGPAASGYNLVAAESLAAAVKMAQTCPLLQFGRQIAVYQIFDRPKTP